MRALTWNLYHGRDDPPEQSLDTWRSRILRRTEVGRTHAQVNRSLLGAFSELLAAWTWDVALLQEAPPRWLRPLARSSGAGGAGALTSRNLFPALRAALADWNPDLIASNEGGSNIVLVRPPLRITAVERLTLTERPERRRALLARLEGPHRRLAVANVHLSVSSTGQAPREAAEAARRATAFAGRDPLLFGGDLNLRPAREPGAFEELRERFGLAPPTSSHAIDHLLARGLVPRELPAALPAEAREVEGPAGLRLRLSDHAPVTASFGLR